MKDLYYILGCNPDASPGELTAAYRKLAQKLQAPGQDDYFLDRHFEDITDAYQVLSNPIQRKKYDAAFRKHQQQKFYFFKLRYLNIAVTLTLIAFTTVFGYYVLKSLSGNHAKKVVVAAVQPTLPPTIKHGKKKYKLKIVNHNKNEKIPAAVKDGADTQPEKIIKPTAPVEKPAPVVTEKKWVSTDVKSPVVNGYSPQPEEKALAPVPSNNNTAILEGNVTGLIYLHQTPNYRSAVVTSIPNHSKVSVLERNQNFYKVSFNNQVGYVPKWTVREE